MMTRESQHLLADYVASGSERAFQELVARYVDLVYSTALRLVEGDTHRARDVAQTVFVDLARKAGSLSPNTMLGGWLHRHTCFVARTLMRGERRRQARERQAMEMSALENHPDASLAEIAPVLDEAIHELGPDDRDAILLRFFERRNLRSVGEALGVNENVAQKRVARALQELSALMRRRGFSVPAAALAAGLAAEAVQAAPVGLALGLAKVAVAKAATTGGIAGSAAKVVAMSKFQIGLVGVLIAAGVVTTLVLQNRSRAGRQDPPQPALLEVAEPQVHEPQDAPVDPPPPLQAPLDAGPAKVSAPKPRPAQAVYDGAGAIRPVSNSTTVPAQIGLPDAALQRFYARPGSRIRLKGTSRLGTWQAESPLIGGFLEIEPGFLQNPIQAPPPGPVLARAEVFVMVNSIKSTYPNGRPYSDLMDAVMYRLLKAETHKRITFRLTDFLLEEPASDTNPACLFQAKGELAVAGVTNAISLPVSLLPLGEGKLKLSGSLSFAMSSFQIQPSAARQFTPQRIQPGDNISIEFEWLVGARSAGSTLPRQQWLTLVLNLPARAWTGVPQDIPLSSYVEPLSDKPRPPLLVPPGLTNVARAATVTSSDKNATAETLAKVIDSDKEASEQSIIYLRKNTQWIQLDLGSQQEIFAVVLWHAHNAPKVYHDVIVGLANEPDFRGKVKTLFNNDRDSSSSLGAGKDREYFETHEGRLLDAKGAQGRYLRFYSKGSTESALNEYTEIEVYGRPAQ